MSLATIATKMEAFAAEAQKLCAECEETKPLSQFYKNGINGKFTQSCCIPCYKKRDKQYRAKKAEATATLKSAASSLLAFEKHLKHACTHRVPA